MKKYFRKMVLLILLTALAAGTSWQAPFGNPFNAYAAAEIKVTRDEIIFLRQELESFQNGQMMGETLCSNIASLIENDERVTAIQESCAEYSSSKAEFVNLVQEYCNLLSILAQSTSDISTQSSSSTQSEIIIHTNIEEYVNALTNAVSSLDQGESETSVMTMVRSGYEFLDDMENGQEIIAGLEDAFQKYAADKAELIELIRSLLDELEAALSEETDPTNPDPTQPIEDDYDLRDPRVTETTDPDTGKTVYNTVWDCIWMGSYPQSDAEGLIKEPIKWRVLDVDGSDAFLLADVNLDNQQYDSTPSYQSTAYVEYTYWETASLREWLNSTFYETAFSENERDAIQTVNVPNLDNPFQKSSGGKTTQDKIYLLSIQEVTNAQYGFPEEFKYASPARKSVNTAYAFKRGAAYSGTTDYQTSGEWLLRSPGRYPEYPYSVPGFASAYCATVYNYDGQGDDVGATYSQRYGVSVRPCMHIDLTSDVWSHAGIVSADGRTAELEPGGTGEPEEPEITEKTASGVLRESDGVSAVWTVHYNTGDDKQAKLTISLEGSSDEYSTSGPFYLDSALGFGEDGIKLMPWLDEEYGLKKDDFVEITIRGTDEVPVQPVVDQFVNYTNVKSVRMEHVSQIGTRAFKNCTSLSSVTVDDDLRIIEDEAFMNTLITDFDFSGVTMIGNRAFASTQLNEITLGKDVKSIGEEAFAGCEGLTIMCYERSAAHQYAVNEHIKYILFEDVTPSPIKLLAMEILCTEYPDQYQHDGKSTNLIGKKIGDLLDDNEHLWFGNSSLDAGHNDTIKGWTKRQLYDQELRNWTITHCYKNYEKGFYAITMECTDTDAKVFVIRNSDDMVSWDTFKSLNYDRMAYELHSLGSDWLGNDFPLYVSQQTGAQLAVASKYLESYMQSLDESDPNLYITGHSLGAGLTIYLSCKYDLPGTAFDAVPMLDAAYFRHPREMGRNYRGHDKWKYVDYINENDALAGLWECNYENYVSCPNLNSSGDWMQAHAPETILYNDNNHIIIPENETHTVKYLYSMKKCMGVQELSYKGGPGNKYAHINIPGKTNQFVDWLSSEANVISYSKGFHTVYCGDGNDVVTVAVSDKKVLIGGRGDDTLTGGSGMDHYYYYKGDGTDTIIDSGGNDQIRIFDFGSGTDFQVKNKNGSNYISIYADNEPIIHISKNRSGGLYSTDQITVNIYDENDYRVNTLTLRDDNNWFKDWKGYQHIKVSCPVELDVYQVNPDGEDEIVLTITDASEPVTETDYGFFYNIPEYDDEGNAIGEYEKQALLYDTANYYVAARATQDGTAEFSAEWAEDTILHTASLSDFAIQESETYRLDLTEAPKVVSTGTGAQTPMEDSVEAKVVSIDIEEADLTLQEGESAVINATYKTNPEGETAQLFWETSDANVAEVNEDGSVHANAAGTCDITVTDITGSIEASIAVTVTEKSASSFTLNYSEAEIKTKDSLQLEVSTETGGAISRKLLWSSSNPAVAEVDGEGLVTALTYGKTTITVTTEDGEITANCQIQTRYYDVCGSPDKNDENYEYWFTPVYWAADNNITKGYGNVYFGPEENCLREQMITFLYRESGSPAVSADDIKKYNSFSDVPGDAYYTKAVVWAAKNGITKGYSSGPNKGKFGVGLNVTREDTVTFIYRMAGKPAYSTAKSFKDVAKGKYYYDPVRWAAQNKITNGYSDGTFGVGKDVLRKDIVTFLYRYANMK